MARELSYLQLVQRSIIKSYRKSIWNSFVEACKKYSLINNGDRICVYLRVDAASLLLALSLKHLQRISDVEFELSLFSKTNSLLDLYELDYIKVNDYDDAVKKAFDRGFNKVAISDNLNDSVNHIVKNMFCNSSIEGVLPLEHCCSIEIIRPLICVKEADIEKWKQYNNIKLITNLNKDEDTDKLVSYIKTFNPDVEHNIFVSTENVKLDTIVGYSENNKQHSFLDKY